MANVGVYFVSCKKDAKHSLQFWIPSLSIIYSQCEHCKNVLNEEVMTGYGQTSMFDHYDLYEVAVKKEKGMTYEDCFKKAEEIVKADLNKYKVNHHSDKLSLEKKRSVKQKI